ncbi:MAG TPA: hypothetical protein VK546_00270 [Gaiellales bacterium]|nr:hypothetical protein [Gaiellales bacterium]
MLTAITITAFLIVGLGWAMRTGRSGELISRTPYNNRYNDASAAREDHLG